VCLYDSRGNASFPARGNAAYGGSPRARKNLNVLSGSAWEDSRRTQEQKTTAEQLESEIDAINRGVRETCSDRYPTMGKSRRFEIREQARECLLCGRPSHDYEYCFQCRREEADELVSSRQGVHEQEMLMCLRKFDTMVSGDFPKSMSMRGTIDKETGRSQRSMSKGSDVDISSGRSQRSISMRSDIDRSTGRPSTMNEGRQDSLRSPGRQGKKVSTIFEEDRHGNGQMNSSNMPEDEMRQSREDPDDGPQAREKLEVEIIRGENLLAADNTEGLASYLAAANSDPYCFVEIGGKPETRQKTVTINKTLNPQWDEFFFFKNYEKGDCLMFEVYDEDYMSADDLLGKAQLSADQIMNCYEGPLLLTDAGEKTGESQIWVRVRFVARKRK